MSPLREAFNVADLKQRDRIVRRFRQIRADAVLDKNTLEHINRIHPDWPPFDTSFEDAVIAWCDAGGEGPFPTLSEKDRRILSEEERRGTTDDLPLFTDRDDAS